MAGAESSTALGPDAGPVGNDAFVSYARANLGVVSALVERLTRAGRTCWVDWARIPPSAEWMSEILTGIERSDAFVVILSPEWIRSEVCALELAHAVAERKKLVPVLVTDVDPAVAPADLATRQWVFARPTDDLDAAAEAIAAALDTDLVAIRRHTQLALRAREWEAGGRGPGLLLRGGELATAESWLTGSDAGPDPTPLQVALVTASRRSATRRQQGLLAAFAAALVVTVSLGGLAWTQRSGALEQARVADSQRLGSAAATVDDRQLGLLLATAGYRLDDSSTTRSNLLAAVARDDGKAWAYPWGHPITSMVGGKGSTLWVSDSTGAARPLDTSTLPGYAVAGAPLRGQAISALSADRTGRWIVTVGPGARLAARSERRATVYFADASTPTEGASPVSLPRPVSAVAPAATARELVVAEPARSGGPATTLSVYSLEQYDRVALGQSSWARPAVSRDLGFPVTALAAAPDGSVLAAWGDPGRAVVARLSPKTLTPVWSTPVAFRPTVLAGGRSGLVAVGGPDGQVVLLDAAGRSSSASSDHTGAVRAIAVSAEGDVASGADDGLVIVRGSDGRRTTWFDEQSGVVGIVWDRVGGLLFSATRAGVVHADDVLPERRLAPVVATGLPAPWLGGSQVALAADGAMVAVVGRGGSSGSLALLDTRTGSVRQVQLPGGQRGAASDAGAGGPTSVAVDGTGSVLVVAGDGPLTRWTASASGLTQQPGSDPIVTASAEQPSVVLSADNARLWAISIRDGARWVQYADPETLAVDPGTPGLETPATARARLPLPVLGFQPDATLLLACGLGCFATATPGATALAPVTTGSDDSTRALGSAGYEVSVAASSADARVAVQGTDGGQVRFFRGQALVPAGAWETAHGGTVVSAAVAADGSLAASGGADGSVVMWEPGTGSRIGLPLRLGFGPTDRVSVVVLGDGRVLSVDSSGTARVMPGTAHGWADLACRVAGRDLTAAEWSRYLPGTTPFVVCPDAAP